MPTFGNGKICYIEIPATEIATSSEFYASAFGWTLRRRGDGAVSFDDGVNEVSGVWVLNRTPLADGGLTIYIMIDDIEDAIEKVIVNGGVIVQPVGADAPEITAKFRDPGGNILGLYQHGGSREKS